MKLLGPMISVILVPIACQTVFSSFVPSSTTIITAEERAEGSDGG